MLVEVAVAAAVRGTFTYRVPAALVPEVALGQRVAVPFGRSRRATGYVVGLPDARAGRASRCATSPAVLDAVPAVHAAARRAHPLGGGVLPRAAGRAAPRRAAARASTPAAARRARCGAGSSTPRRSPRRRTRPRRSSRAPAQRAVLEYLLARGRIPLEELRRAFPHGRAALAALDRRGLVRLERETPVARSGLLAAAADAPALNAAQAAALAAIEAAFGAFATFLLHGVTGSGKTEVYLQAIARARAAGKGALVLVPEIALTPQLSGRFRARFGDDVALLHSGLSGAERHAEWLRLRRGEARICVGVRSAIFAPVQDLAVIVVDEEHEGSFKQEDGPAYHARDLAVVRGKLEGAVVILGSATPSLETLENARRGRYRRLELPSRIDDRPLPTVELVDLRRLRRPGQDLGPGLLSPRLVEALAATVAAGQQAILFLNRRGYQTLVVCEGCGEEARCPDCSIALTHHARRGVLLCHACGRSERMDARCPACGGIRFGVGVGTEQVEEAARAHLPGARVARLDRDAVGSADDTAALLARFARRDLDVLVGTQMVTKGHDFPGVTLVGVVLADTGLALPDFRAARADLPAPHAGRRPRRARRGAGAGPRPDVQPRDPRGRPRRPARLRGLRRGGARGAAPARVAAVHAAPRGARRGVRDGRAAGRGGARPRRASGAAGGGRAARARARRDRADPRPDPLAPPLPRGRPAAALPRPRGARGDRAAARRAARQVRFDMDPYGML